MYPTQIDLTLYLRVLCSQPDGYLTEERKAADPDQGFSTFFSETGMGALTLLMGDDKTSNRILSRPGQICPSYHLLRLGAQCRR